MQCLRWALLVSIFVFMVQAAPLDAGEEEGKGHIAVGEPASDRTIFTVMSLVAIMVMSGILGSRFAKLRDGVKRRSSVAIIVSLLYFFAIPFVICAACLVAGQGLFNYQLCLAGTWVCLIFYAGIKGTIFAFFVERIHVVRTPFYTRRKDPLYLSCTAMVVILYSTALINLYCNVRPVTKMYNRCHFGITSTGSIPLISVNLFMDLVLTGVFFFLLRPVAKGHIFARTGSGNGNDNNTPPSQTPLKSGIRTVLWKSIIGSLLIDIPMAANMFQFVITNGNELGTVCLITCIVDAFWDILVMHWLTLSSADAESRLACDGASSLASLTRGPSIPSVVEIERCGTEELARSCEMQRSTRHPTVNVLPVASPARQHELV